MKVCFIGSCGHWQQALSTLKSRGDVLLCGFAPGSSEENRRYSIDESLPYFEDYREMLDTVKPDLVVLSPVFGITGRLIIECAERGIAVFSEKPIASSNEELKRVVAAIRKSKIPFCSMHYTRFSPAFYHAAKIIEDGKIGQIRMITAQKSYRYGVRPDWYSDPELYCGTIPWVGIHAVDWIYRFTGKRFTSVSSIAVGECPEMAALCQFELEGGIIASINIDYYRPDGAPTHDDDRIRCVGTSGVLEIRSNTVLLINKEGSREYRPSDAPDLFAEFLDGKNPIGLDEIHHVTKAVLCAKDAAKHGKTVRIGA